MIDRRTFLLGSSAWIGLTAAQAPPGAATGRDQALHLMLQQWFDEDLRDSPTFATSLGLDVGALAFLRGRLGDSSRAKADADRARAIERDRMLRAFGRDGLSPDGLLNHDIAEFRQAVAAARARFRYDTPGGWPTPYAVSQMDGAYYGVPDFLDSQHPVRTREDADFYLARLEDFARNLDQETARIGADAAEGVVPPDFVLDKTIGNLRRLRDRPAAESVLVRSLVRRAAEAGLGDQEAAATRLVAGPIAAALDAQIAVLTRLRPNATHDAGVWKLPDGEAYYAVALRADTTTEMGADEIHRLGLTQVAELEGQLDALLRAQGYATGSAGARLQAIGAEERFLYSNDDAGRAALLADLNRQMAELEPLLPRVFATLPRARVEIRRVPPDIEAGAPSGYYEAAPIDGSRPGVYYINLRDMREWARPGLPSLTYHEASPGHHLQSAIARQSGDLPLYRRTRGFPAYNDGWALYAEGLAAELGVYENNPFGRIGFLQSYLFRAVRLVVDTGLHHKRWSREQAIRYMVETAGEPEGSAVREIERYCVWPGQACAYKIGHTVVAGLRAEAERRMGARFDIKGFHDAVLLGGYMPLSVLQRRVRDWIG